MRTTIGGMGCRGKVVANDQQANPLREEHDVVVGKQSFTKRGTRPETYGGSPYCRPGSACTAGMSRPFTLTAAAMHIADGNVSFDDCDMLT